MPTAEMRKNSTGPRTVTGKMRARCNALKFGLVSRELNFEDPEEEKQFQGQRSILLEEIQPQSVLEELLVEEIALCLFKLGVTERLALREISKRSESSEAILELFTDSSHAFPDPFSGRRDKLQRIGWSTIECRELLLTTDGSSKAEELTVASKDKEIEKKSDRIQIQAKLGSAADTILRYQNAWRRDLYRAINMLRSLQSGREGGEMG